MIPAPSLSDVLERAEFGGQHRPLRDRVVSILFAQPTSMVVEHLETNRLLWDELTGDSWDLFFAGYFAYGGDHYDKTAIDVDREPDGVWRFSPRFFRDLMQDVERASASNDGPSWRFSGKADLVSFMVYGETPDWQSLRTVQLVGEQSASHSDPTLGSAIEGLRRWQTEEPNERFAPGQSPYRDFVPAAALADVLRWSAAAAIGGLLGNRFDGFFTKLVGR